LISGNLFSSFGSLPEITALANVELPIIYAGENNKKERALESLETVSISKRAYYRPSEMSGGERL
jgi:putative ABC transport system ATP-binding protein